MLQSAAIEFFESKIQETDDFSDISGSEIVVIAAGLTRKSGMAREDLISKNTSIVKSVSDKIKKYAPNSIIIVVTNPMDLMSYVCIKTTGFPRDRVLGMGGILDSARFRYFISQNSI